MNMKIFILLTTLYTVGDNTTVVLTNMSSLAQKLFTWFDSNKMKGNHDKCHLLLSTQESSNIQTANFTTKSSKVKKLLGINLDNNLKFDIQVESICQNTFFKAQYNYCSAIWMFHSRTLNNKISRLYERCLRIIYNDKLLNYEKHLDKDNYVSIHHNNMHAPAIEMYKVVIGMSREIINEDFKQTIPIII